MGQAPPPLPDMAARLEHPERPDPPWRDYLYLQTLPQANARGQSSARRLYQRGRDRPDPPPRRQVRGSRGQSAGAQRRLLYADQPESHEADLPGAVSEMRRAAHRAI